MTRGERSAGVQLGVLTGAKVVANTAMRWVGPFLPTLERAFETSTSTLTSVIGVAELGGLTTFVTGHALDRGHRRRMFLAGLALVGIASSIALIGSIISFAIAFALVVIGVGNLSTAGHAWISDRVPYQARGRALGTFETGWALSLLLGASGIAALIEVFGWRGPFVALAVATVVAFVAVLVFVSPDRTTRRSDASPAGSIPASAWKTLTGSALIAASAISVFVVSGAWLDDRHGVSTAGLGLVATGFGAMELVASTSAAAFSDRVGLRRSVLIGLGGLALGLAVAALSGDSTFLAIIGLLVFLCGFEYAFVTSLSLVTEAAPLARGRAIGVGNALGTIARSAAVLGSGLLYDGVGIGGSFALSVATAAIAAVLTASGMTNS
jgi:MFS transporter, DHA1 family, inner membrane transport protein